MVDGVLLAIGGAENRYELNRTSAINAFHHSDQKWRHVGNMPFKCAYLETTMLSGGRLLVVDGYNKDVLEMAEGMLQLTGLFSGLNPKQVNERCVDMY